MRKGWEKRQLGDIADNLDKKRIPITQSKRTKGDIPYYGASGIVDYVNDYIFNDDLLLVSEDGANLLARTYPIAFSIKGKTWVNNHAHVLKFENVITQQYVEYYINSIDISDYVSGMAQPKLNQAMLNAIPIPVPPLSEQKQIVAILDKAFAAIDRAKAIAEQNLRNARELFDSYLNEIFTKKGEGWEEKELGEIANVEYGYTDKARDKGAYRFVRITDIDKNGELIFDEKKYIDKSVDATAYLLYDNDLLMARTGATFAKVLLYKDHEPSVFASFLIRIKFKVQIENELYWFFTKTNRYWEQANMLASGAAQPQFNGAAVKKVIFQYPLDVGEQKNLIKKFYSIQKEVRQLEKVYQQKIDNLEELKKSILQRAFAGELVSEPLIATD